MKFLTRRLLPPFILALTLGLIPFIPESSELLPSAASPNLPLEYDLSGWHGTKTQESQEERRLLADDTLFSKAIYKHVNPFTYSTEEPTISVSFVYSGSDLNNSIHRPERCLPSQGHLEVTGQDSVIELADGRKLTFRKLTSYTLLNNKVGKHVNHIHYYVFVGNDNICHSHIVRTWRDIWGRVATGTVQRWAYIQFGTYWGEEVGVTEEQADKCLRALIRDLVPQQIDWKAVEN